MLLFARAPVLGVAWLRIASAAVIFAVWRRPWRRWRALSRAGRALLGTWGLNLAVMNCCFYEAIDRLPLSTVAAIEFLPVVALAALGARTVRNAIALAAAVAGAYILTGVQFQGHALGFVFAFANAGLFASYIVLAHRVAQHEQIEGLDGLALAMLIAAAIVTPIAATSLAKPLTDPIALLAGAGVGISSSVIPYVTDQLAMARLARASYSLMVSLLPATAAVVGAIVLAQIPSPAQVIGIALVITGIAIHRGQDESAPNQDDRAANLHPAAREEYRRA